MEQAEIGNNEHVVRLLEVHNSCSLNIVFGFFSKILKYIFWVLLPSAYVTVVCAAFLTVLVFLGVELLDGK